jgi:hypothetical protein
MKTRVSGAALGAGIERRTRLEGKHSRLCRIQRFVVPIGKPNYMLDGVECNPMAAL